MEFCKEEQGISLNLAGKMPTVLLGSTSERHGNQTLNPNKKGDPKAALFFIAVRVWLYLGVNPLFEDELLVFFELFTVFQAFVLVLTDHLTT